MQTNPKLQKFDKSKECKEGEWRKRFKGLGLVECRSQECSIL
jgi:hypothetical protein